MIYDAHNLPKTVAIYDAHGHQLYGILSIDTERRCLETATLDLKNRIVTFEPSEADPERMQTHLLPFRWCLPHTSDGVVHSLTIAFDE